MNRKRDISVRVMRFHHSHSIHDSREPAPVKHTNVPIISQVRNLKPFNFLGQRVSFTVTRPHTVLSRGNVRLRGVFSSFSELEHN